MFNVKDFIKIDVKELPARKVVVTTCVDEDCDFHMTEFTEGEKFCFECGQPVGEMEKNIVEHDMGYISRNIDTTVKAPFIEYDKMRNQFIILSKREHRTCVSEPVIDLTKQLEDFNKDAFNKDPEWVELLKAIDRIGIKYEKCFGYVK